MDGTAPILHTDAPSFWDASSVTDVSGMFDGADLFDQNLGPRHIALDDLIVTVDDRVASNITAQNYHLSGHNPAYSVTGEHADLF